MTEMIAQADVLGRLLVLQQMLDAMPDETRIGEFVRRALMTVPGVSDVLICIGNRMIPADTLLQPICAKHGYEQNATACTEIAALDDQAGMHYFPVRTASHHFGFVIVRVADQALLQPYLGFLSNIANAIGMLLDTRLYQAKLTEANAQLRRAADELEIRVANRTRELAFLSTHDRLTGLANRALLVDRMQQAISSGHRYGRMVAVAFLDLDNFKYISDSRGTQVGDEVLKETARRLLGTLQENDTVARVGSDEFVLILTDQESAVGTGELMARILAVVREPIYVKGQEVVVTGSIGCSFYPGDGDDHETLFRRANAAMYNAKELGRDTFSFFCPGLDAAVAERGELETELRHAMPRDELMLYYQPQLELRTGKLVGVEALLRWCHPKKGIIYPAKFIPIAEDSALIVTLGEWALREACRQARVWQDEGIDGAAVAVNLSARQFRDKRIVDTVRSALQETGLDPARLELEITESSLMRDFDQVVAIMLEFKMLGVLLSIDDFGTGYSNLNYLRRFPVDKLKIDQSFVHDVETTESAAAVARAVIVVGQSLHLKVIAEGVETVGQAIFLHQNGCDEMQGYLIARPQPAQKLQDLLTHPPTFPWTAESSA